MIDKELQIKITDYIENSMSNSEKLKFEAYLNENSKIKQEVLQIREMISDIKNVDSLRLSSSFDDRLKHSIDIYDNKKNNSLNIFKLFDNPVYSSLGAVAAVLLVVMVTFFRPSISTANESMVIDNSGLIDNIDEVAEIEPSSDDKIDYDDEELYEINRSFQIQRVEDSKVN